MSSTNRIHIPIIPYGLRQEETITQIAFALQTIDSVVNDVFQQIEENIQKHRTYLSSLQKRSEIVAAKVEKLAGKNVITTVYSHHKYPFEGHNVNTLFKLNLKSLPKKPDIPIRSKFQHAKYNKALNKLHFFHVKSNYDSPTELPFVCTTGLGDVPPNISSIDSLYLFNTSHNLYKNYVTLDPLTTKEPRLQIPEETKEGIADAPNSIVNNQELPKSEYFDYFYTPAFEEVPNINVPTDLPDLPGIAGGTKTAVKIEPVSVAPSKPSQEVDKSKSLEDITIADLPVIRKPKSTSTKQTRDADVVCPKPEEVKASTESVAPSPPPIMAPPPPPPPPMPLEQSYPVDKPKPHNVISSDNLHANLMEAIRNAGGREKAKLRQVSEVEKVSGQPESKESQEGLFMTDLYAALARRRKGISGLHKDDKNPSMMERVSSMIEPATPDDSDENNEEDGNEWDE